MPRTDSPMLKGDGSVTEPMPVPVKATDCGLLDAPSVKLRVEAGTTPRAVGAKVTPTVQLAPEATGAAVEQAVPEVGATTE